jgi:hypothetical protein
MSSGNRRIHRLSQRGNRQLNHAIHMAAFTQIRYPGTIGRNYYDRKLAEGMAHKSALRALKRRISDALYAQLIAAHRRTTRGHERDQGGQSGNDSACSASGSHPEHPALRTSQELHRISYSPCSTSRPTRRTCFYAEERMQYGRSCTLCREWCVWIGQFTSPTSSARPRVARSPSDPLLGRAAEVRWLEESNSILIRAASHSGPGGGCDEEDRATVESHRRRAGFRP